MNTFVSESITPVFDQGTGKSVGAGEPVVPSGFIWRDREYRVEAVLQVWKETGSCRSGSSERYLRKHWYRMRMTNGQEMEIYFERQARSAKQRKMRWWLFSVSDEAVE